MENSNLENPTPPFPSVEKTPPQTSSISNIEKVKPKFPIIIALIMGAIVLLVNVSLGFYLYKQQRLKINTKPTPSPITKVQAPTPTIDPASNAANATANWKTYNNLDFGYSFKYPADFITYPGAYNVFHSSDAKFDKTTTAKTSGLEIGSTVYGPGEDIKRDTQGYIGPNTKGDAELTSKLILPSGFIAKTYVNWEDIVVTMDYKKDNQNMRIMIWCGGENGDSTECKNVLIPILSTFKFVGTNQNQTSCASDADCEKGAKCMTIGPIVANQPVKKICSQENAAIPL